uniref:CG5993 n=1 Tax=Macrostomum lignano TaxID=282301 RepID=A0A1I8IEB9_9PLAT
GRQRAVQFEDELEQLRERRELGPAPPLPKSSPPQQQQTESSGKKTATVRPHPRPAPPPSQPPAADQSSPQQQQQRSRPYDQEKIKEYLQQQKERRRQAKIEAERQRAAEAAALQQKLKDLRQRQLEAPSVDTLNRWCAVRDAASSLEDRVSRMARPGGHFWGTLHPPHLSAAATSANPTARLPLPGYRESPPAPMARAVTPADAVDDGVEDIGDNGYAYAEAQRLAEQMPRGLDRIGRALLLHNFCAGQPAVQQSRKQPKSPLGRRTRRSEGALPPKRYNLLHTLEHESADPFAFRAVYNRQREAYARRQNGGSSLTTSPQPPTAAASGGGGMMDGSMRPEDLRLSPSAAATVAVAPSRPVVDRDVQTAPSAAPTAVIGADSSYTAADRDTRRRQRQRQRDHRSRSRSRSRSGSEEKEENKNSDELKRPASPPP